MRDAIDNYIKNRQFDKSLHDDWEVRHYHRDSKTNHLDSGPDCIVCENVNTKAKYQLDLLNGCIEFYVEAPESPGLIEALPAGGQHYYVSETLPELQKINHSGFVLKKDGFNNYALHQMNSDDKSLRFIYIDGTESQMRLKIFGIQLSSNIGAVLPELTHPEFKKALPMMTTFNISQCYSVLSLRQGKNQKHFALWESYEDIGSIIQVFAQQFKWPSGMTTALQNFVNNAKNDLKTTLESISSMNQQSRIVKLWNYLNLDFSEATRNSSYKWLQGLMENANTPAARDMKLVYDSYSEKYQCEQNDCVFSAPPEISNALKTMEVTTAQVGITQLRALGYLKIGYPLSNNRPGNVSSFNPNEYPPQGKFVDETQSINWTFIRHDTEGMKQFFDYVDNIKSQMIVTEIAAEEGFTFTLGRYDSLDEANPSVVDLHVSAKKMNNQFRFLICDGGMVFYMKLPNISNHYLLKMMQLLRGRHLEPNNNNTLSERFNMDWKSMSWAVKKTEFRHSYINPMFYESIELEVGNCLYADQYQKIFEFIQKLSDIITIPECFITAVRDWVDQGIEYAKTQQKTLKPHKW